MSYSHIVVGGGVYGCYLALKLADIAPEAKILILEKEDDFFKHASYNNQARIHNGYHYPRSLLTALRSRVNFPHFLQEFPETVTDSFTKVYAIASQRSKVTAKQFYTFCQRIEAEIAPAPSNIKNLFNLELIDEAFLVKEYAFDAKKLKEVLKSRLAQKRVAVLTNVEAIKIIHYSDKRKSRQSILSLLVKNQISGETGEYTCDYLYNCTYSSLNHLLSKSNLDIIPLKHEATEMALIEVPDSLAEKGITIMCGPFFRLCHFQIKDYQLSVTLVTRPIMNGLKRNHLI
jgi:hypothetical protein